MQQPSIVTFTGADDNTDPQRMPLFFKQFPVVEFGILVSTSNEGTARYPSKAWIDRFLNQTNVSFAVHIQGQLLRDLLAGGTQLLTLYPQLIQRTKRIQLNFHRGVEHLSEAFKDRVENDFNGKEFIFQCDGRKGEPLLKQSMAWKWTGAVFPLFDKSGGAGVLPTQWPFNRDYTRAGYAGGLGAHNIEGQLPLIAAAANGKPYWIDMETWVCDPAKGLLFDECKKVLEVVYPERK